MTTLVASEHHLRIFRPEVDATCRTHQNQGKIMSAPRHPPVTNQAFVNLPGRKSRLKTANIIRRIREHARSHAEQPSERGKGEVGVGEVVCNLEGSRKDDAVVCPQPTPAAPTSDESRYFSLAVGSTSSYANGRDNA
jgi:hypothetical protein